MLYSVFFSLCFAQESSLEALKSESATEKKNIAAEEISSPEAIWVINSGLDSNLALSLVSAASKQPTKALKSTTILDITTTNPISILEGGTITSCSTTPISNARLKKISRELDHSLSYYDLEKSELLFQAAEQGLACLRDTLDPDVVAHLFFLEGILHYNNGDLEKSKNAYSNAVRFNPAIHWDNMFSPDYKDLFEQAKSGFSQIKEVPLEVYPKMALSSLWVNGVPYSEGETPTVYIGDNIIQVLGAQTQNAKLHVNQDATKVVLALPSILPASAISWVSDSQKQPELSMALQGIVNDRSLLYFYHSGEVWKTTLQSDNTTSWTRLEIPKMAMVMGANTKKTLGTGLFWTGTAITLGGSLYSGAKLNDAYTVSADAQVSKSYDVYANQKADFTTLQEQYQTGIIITGVGLGLTGLGYWLER